MKNYVNVTDPNYAKSKANRIVEDGSSDYIINYEDEKQNEFFELPSSFTHKKEESIFVRVTAGKTIIYNIISKNGIHTYSYRYDYD